MIIARPDSRTSRPWPGEWQNGRVAKWQSDEGEHKQRRWRPSPPRAQSLCPLATPPLGHSAGPSCRAGAGAPASTAAAACGLVGLGRLVRLLLALVALAAIVLACGGLLLGLGALLVRVRAIVRLVEARALEQNRCPRPDQPLQRGLPALGTLALR